MGRNNVHGFLPCSFLFKEVAVETGVRWDCCFQDGFLWWGRHIVGKLEGAGLINPEMPTPSLQGNLWNVLRRLEEIPMWPFGLFIASFPGGSRASVFSGNSASMLSKGACLLVLPSLSLHATCFSSLHNADVINPPYIEQKKEGDIPLWPLHRLLIIH